jgi:hypothetical protein
MVKALLKSTGYKGHSQFWPMVLKKYDPKTTDAYLWVSRLNHLNPIGSLNGSRMSTVNFLKVGVGILRKPDRKNLFGISWLLKICVKPVNRKTEREKDS